MTHTRTHRQRFCRRDICLKALAVAVATAADFLPLFLRVFACFHFAALLNAATSFLLCPKNSNHQHWFIRLSSPDFMCACGCSGSLSSPCIRTLTCETLTDWEPDFVPICERWERKWVLKTRRHSVFQSNTHTTHTLIPIQFNGDNFDSVRFVYHVLTKFR